MLERIISEAQESRFFAEYLSELCDERAAEPDRQRLVVAIRNFGLDPIDLRFDVSTFDDLAVRLIVERMDMREALVVFHARDHALGALAGIGGEILQVLNERLALRERSPASGRERTLALSINN